jgi:transposase
VGNKYTKRYTEEFKRDAIALVDSSGKTVTAAARETRHQLRVATRLVPQGQDGPGARANPAS